jgi:hypothetical protein
MRRLKKSHTRYHMHNLAQSMMNRYVRALLLSSLGQSVKFVPPRCRCPNEKYVQVYLWWQVIQTILPVVF